MGTFLNQPWPYLATAVLAALMLLSIHVKPHRPGVRWFSWLIGTYLVWALAAVGATIARSIPMLYGFFILQAICSLGVTALELLVVLEYTGSETWIARRILLLLFLPPLLLFVIAYIFPESMASLHVHSGSVVFIGEPLVKWSFYGYVAVMFLICLGVLFTRLMRAPAFRAPIVILMIGVVFPVAAFMFIRSENISVPPIQASILTTNVTMLAYFVALYSFRILQVIPIARDMLISRIPYSLIVLDSENRLVDFNTAAQALPGLPGKLVLQQAASRALGDWWERLAPLLGPVSSTLDVSMQAGHAARIFHVTSLPLLQENGWRLGQVFMLEDVTQVRQAQQHQEQALRSLATLKEREHLARELHDSLGQSLAATHLLANTAKLLIGQGETAQAQKYLDQVSELTLAAEADVREYLLGAKLTISVDQQFFAALRAYLMRFSQQYSLHVRLSVSPQLESQGLETVIEVQLLRIIQEALSNIRKHAHAQSTQVIFTDSEQIVQVAVIDDGQGFDPLIVEGQVEGFGLRSMRERAEALGGSFEVTSQPGQGTQVLIRVPLQREEPYGEGIPIHADTPSR